MLLLRVLVNRTATGVVQQRASALFRARLLPVISSAYTSSSSGFKNSAPHSDAGVATSSSVSEDNASSSNGEETSASSRQRSAKSFQYSTSSKLRKGNHKRYDNYAPLLFQWTHQLVNGELSLEALMASEKYLEVSRAICDTTRHSDKNILNLLKSLVIMNLDPDTRLVQFLENELLLKLNHFDLRLLMAAYQIYSPPHVAMSSLLRGQIVDSINRNINDRLDTVELASLTDLIGLIKNSRHFTPEILLKIEDQTTRFLDATETISLDQLCYLLVLLSRYSRRNKPLIRAVVAKLLRYRAEDVYSMPPHLIHMISSLNRLNFPEVNLLEKCSDILINLNFLEVTTDSPRRDFLVAISQFNFCYPKLIDYYLGKLQEKPELFKRQDLITLTITLARLNYRSEDFLELLSARIVPECSGDPAEFVSRHQYFNYVYSLALLGRAPAEELRRLCSRQFLAELESEAVEVYLIKAREREARQMAAQGLLPPVMAEEVEEGEELPSSSSSSSSLQQLDPADIYQVMSLRRKYLTLAGLVLVDRNQQPQDVFSSEEERSAFEAFIGSLEYEPMKRNKDLVVFRQNVFKLLENFAPSGRYLVADQKLPYGFAIDAQLLVDAEGQPHPLDSTQPNLKRVALMCIGFNDTLLDSSHQLIGPKEAEVRILRALGYLVVPVHQNVIPSGTTALSRVKFLQNLIASHLRGEAATEGTD